MSRTVFIVGAGASVESGAPVMATFLDRAYRFRRDTNVNLTQRQKNSFDLVFIIRASRRFRQPTPSRRWI